MKLRHMLSSALVILASGCTWYASKTPPSPTGPAEVVQYAAPTQPGISFRNLTHDSISPYWGHRKSDGEDSNILNAVFRRGGLNWVPADTLGLPAEAPRPRLAKRTACGHVDRAALFTGAGVISREHDWGFLLLPEDPSLVDTIPLARNAGRVYQITHDIPGIDETGKYFNTEHWNKERQGAKRFLVEAEVTPAAALIGSSRNPFPCKGGCKLVSLPVEGTNDTLTNLPDRLCAYGPWVQEAFHGFRPEIHPTEALYWRTPDGAWHLLMLQDASGRFDASIPSDWFTLSDSPLTTGEHWIQEAMVGELRIPTDSLPAGWTIQVVEHKGLEHIGDGGFPASALRPEHAVVPTQDARIEAVILPPTAAAPRTLALRAQIRGASHKWPLVNDGAYLLLRIGSSAP